jgi:hypothetical protein
MMNNFASQNKIMLIMLIMSKKIKIPQFMEFGLPQNNVFLL